MASQRCSALANLDQSTTKEARPGVPGLLYGADVRGLPFRASPPGRVVQVSRRRLPGLRQLVDGLGIEGREKAPALFTSLKATADGE